MSNLNFLRDKNARRKTTHDSDDDARREKDEGDGEPEDAPDLRRAAADDLGKGRGIRLVDFAEDEIVADVPYWFARKRCQRHLIKRRGRR